MRYGLQQVDASSLARADRRDKKHAKTVLSWLLAGVVALGVVGYLAINIARQPTRVPHAIDRPFDPNRP